MHRIKAAAAQVAPIFLILGAMTEAETGAKCPPLVLARLFVCAESKYAMVTDLVVWGGTARCRIAPDLRIPVCLCRRS
jgi:hypothetical protein